MDGSQDSAGQAVVWRVMVGLCAAATGICYADRANIADAIVPMAAEFDFSRTQEAAVLSAFFLGYAATGVLGGWLSDRYGGKVVLPGAVAAWSLATLLTPLAAAAGLPALLLARVGLGAAEGPAFPAVHALIASSVPKQAQVP